MHQNPLKNGKLFLILINDGWMVDLAMSIFEFLTKFLVFWHPWVCIRRDLKPLFETDISDSSYRVIGFHKGRVTCWQVVLLYRKSSLGGFNNRDMSLIETWFYSRLYSIRLSKLCIIQQLWYLVRTVLFSFQSIFKYSPCTFDYGAL